MSIVIDIKYCKYETEYFAMSLFPHKYSQYVRHNTIHGHTSLLSLSIHLHDDMLFKTSSKVRMVTSRSSHDVFAGGVERG